MFTSFENQEQSFLAIRHCLKVFNASERVHMTNQSLTSSRVSCSDSPIYEILLVDSSLQKTQDLKKKCHYVPEDGIELCLFTILRNDTFGFSELHPKMGIPLDDVHIFDVELFFSSQQHRKTS
ncbi:unnamed protein product [Agarophyton chilense]